MMSILSNIQKFIKKERIFDFIFFNSIKINIITIIFVFISLWISTNFLNAFSIFAFHMLFSGIISSVAFEKIGLSYIQFERYRDDIDVIKEKRSVVLTLSIIVSGVFLYMVFKNINIYDYIL